MTGGASILNFEPLPAATVWWLTAPLRAYFSPRFYGLANIARDRPTLFVGNHTIYGVLDAPLMAAEIYKRTGVYVRSLADRMHHGIPGWSELLGKLGAVVGTREHCAMLMRAGASVLVYPGGGREVAKRKGEAYKLIWKERIGFVHMAVRHGYTITPFASVGPEHAYSIIIDADDVLRSPLGALLERSGIARRFLRDGDIIMPIARGLGLTPFPRPERFYFSFGAPLDTRRLRGRHEDKAALLALRARVADSVNAQIRRLLRLRASDRDRSLLRRVLTKFG